MPTRRLDEFVTVVSTGGFGGGTASIGPTRYSEVWRVTNIAVRAENVGGTNVELVCRVYSGGAVPGRMVDSTYDGISDASDLKVTLHSGQQLTAVWATEPAVLAGFPRLTLSVYGEMDY